MTKRAWEMDCCRVIAPDIVVETVVGATVVVTLLLTVLFVSEVTTDRSMGFVLTWVVGVPSTPVVAL